MSTTLTIRLPATKHQRLKDFARARSVSLNKLVEEWATVALAQRATGWGTDQSAGSSGGCRYGNLFGKIPPRIVVLSLIPWRSSRPNPFLDRQQPRVERVGMGTGHDQFQ